MKLSKSIIWIVLVCIPFGVFAQERLTVSGVEYIVHKVEKKQTLYAIGKTYSVRLDAILNANPSVEGGLNTGQRLLIPVAAINKKAQKKAPVIKDGALIHVVRKKETWYSIGKQYDVELADLLERNPNNSAGLRPGDHVVIPTEKVKSVDPKVTRVASAEQGRFHTVAVGETLYGISKLYGLEVEELKQLNGLNANEIGIGSIIRLPQTKKEEESKNVQRVFDLKSTYNIGFFLPFSLDRNDSVYVESGNDALYPLTDISMQFYFGALMALDTLKSRGLNAKVHFEDVGEDASTIHALREKRNVRDMDLIIGPFHRKAVEAVAALTKESNTPVVCPVTQSNRILIDKPNVFKAKSGRVEQVDAITTHVSNQSTRGNVIIFLPELERERELQAIALKSLQAKMPNIEIHQISDIRDEEKFKTHFQLDEMNLVIIPSENHSVVSGLLTKLNGISDLHPMTVYGLQKWAEFENIDLAYKEKLNVHLAMSDWVDRNDKYTQDFVRSFREQHNNDPSSYAFLGYDVTLYFGHQLLVKGNSFPEQVSVENGHEVKTLHMPIDIRSTGIDSGKRNVGVLLLNHHDMKLKREEDQ